MQGYLILLKTIKTSLYLTPESPGKMVLKTHWQLTSVLRVNFPQKRLHGWCTNISIRSILWFLWASNNPCKVIWFYSKQLKLVYTWRLSRHAKMVLKIHWQLTTSVLRVNFPQKSFMADAQISQSGPFFPKTKVSDAKCFDSALQADFDDEPVVLYSVQDAWIWFFSHKSLIVAC